MDTRELNGHINAVRELLRKRRLLSGDAATVAQWTAIACGMDLLDNRHSDTLKQFVMTLADVSLKESERAGFRVERRIIRPTEIR